MGTAQAAQPCGHPTVVAPDKNLPGQTWGATFAPHAMPSTTTEVARRGAARHMAMTRDLVNEPRGGASLPVGDADPLAASGKSGRRTPQPARTALRPLPVSLYSAGAPKSRAQREREREREHALYSSSDEEGRTGRAKAEAARAARRNRRSLTNRGTSIASVAGVRQSQNQGADGGPSGAPPRASAAGGDALAARGPRAPSITGRAGSEVGSESGSAASCFYGPGAPRGATGNPKDPQSEAAGLAARARHRAGHGAPVDAKEAAFEEAALRGHLGRLHRQCDKAVEDCRALEVRCATLDNEVRHMDNKEEDFSSNLRKRDASEAAMAEEARRLEDALVTRENLLHMRRRTREALIEDRAQVVMRREMAEALQAEWEEAVLVDQHAEGTRGEAVRLANASLAALTDAATRSDALLRSREDALLDIRARIQETRAEVRAQEDAKRNRRVAARNARNQFVTNLMDLTTASRDDVNDNEHGDLPDRADPDVFSPSTEDRRTAGKARRLRQEEEAARAEAALEALLRAAGVASDDPADLPGRYAAAEERGRALARDVDRLQRLLERRQEEERATRQAWSRAQSGLDTVETATGPATSAAAEWRELEERLEAAIKAEEQAETERRAVETRLTRARLGVKMLTTALAVFVGRPDKPRGWAVPRDGPDSRASQLERWGKSASRASGVAVDRLRARADASVAASGTTRRAPPPRPPVARVDSGLRRPLPGRAQSMRALPPESGSILATEAGAVGDGRDPRRLQRRLSWTESAQQSPDGPALLAAHLEAAERRVEKAASEAESRVESPGSRVSRRRHRDRSERRDSDVSSWSRRRDTDASGRSRRKEKRTASPAATDTNPLGAAVLAIAAAPDALARATLSPDRSGPVWEVRVAVEAARRLVIQTWDRLEAAGMFRAEKEKASATAASAANTDVDNVGSDDGSQDGSDPVGERATTSTATKVWPIEPDEGWDKFSFLPNSGAALGGAAGGATGGGALSPVGGMGSLGADGTSAAKAPSAFAARLVGGGGAGEDVTVVSSSESEDGAPGGATGGEGGVGGGRGSVRLLSAMGRGKGEGAEEEGSRRPSVGSSRLRPSGVRAFG